MSDLAKNIPCRLEVYSENIVVLCWSPQLEKKAHASSKTQSKSIQMLKGLFPGLESLWERYLFHPIRMAGVTFMAWRSSQCRDYPHQETSWRQRMGFTVKTFFSRLLEQLSTWLLLLTPILGLKMRQQLLPGFRNNEEFLSGENSNILKWHWTQAM